MEAGAGEVWLLAPASKKSPIHAFLHDRGLPGVIGATLLAGSVPAAAALIGGRTGHKLTPYSGQLGSSIRVPPELACGIWLEFAQYLVPASQAH